jgi:beta-glucosidase
MAWYPGMEGGNAIADVIFGNVNPSGKLPVTFHKSEDQLPSFDNRVDFIDYDYWHGYRLFEKEGHEPSYPFGFGLSYTEYKYKNLRLDKKKTTKCGKITASVDVTNTGDKAGEEIVQLYVGYKDSAVYRSKKDLKGFARVALEPGETKTVSIEIKPKDLAFWCMKDDKWVVEEIEYIVYIGPSSKREDLLSDTFRVSG